MSYKSLDQLVADKEESIEDSLQEHFCDKHEPICEEHREFLQSDREFGDAPPSRRRLLCGEERVWAPLLSVMVASLPALLFGCTLGFPSPVLLNLMELDREEIRFDTLLSDLFSVSWLVLHTIKRSDDTAHLHFQGDSPIGLHISLMMKLSSLNLGDIRF